MGGPSSTTQGGGCVYVLLGAALCLAVLWAVVAGLVAWLEADGRHGRRRLPDLRDREGMRP